MRRHLAVPLALLFIALGVPSNAQNAGDEALVSVDEGAPLTVECALRVEERAEWRLDGGAVPADLRPAGEAAAGGKLTARVHTPAARPHHAGVYTCASQPLQRIRVRVRPAPLRAQPGAGETAAAPAPNPVAPVAAPESPLPLQYYIVGLNFTLNCSTSSPADAGTYVWKKNNTAVELWPDLRGRYKLAEGGAIFTLGGRTTENDFGNYSCAVGTGAPLREWDVRGRAVAKLPPNANVVEKQSVKLTCKVGGKPYPPVVWTVSNSTEDNGTDVREHLGERVKLQASEQGVENGELVLSGAERWDAGLYTCTPQGPDALHSSTTLRVKDQYAALWPFLGICAEVFVLCAIILVYEKRRTKPELDDSDTDNHDQKKS